jgi:hypothetical protein
MTPVNERCASQPISHLRLERYALQELPAAERAHVDQHLAQCSTCRQCFEALQANEIVLLSLPAALTVSAQRPRVTLPPPKSNLRRIGTIGAMLAAAAVALLVVRSTLSPDIWARPLPPSSIKGGEIALELVRERDGDTSFDRPHSYRSGDRFQVLVTCPPGAPMHWEAVVFQADEAFFPLSPGAPIACGNHIPLPGAFRLTGHKPTTVCVALDSSTPIDRARITKPAALPEQSVCAHLTALAP